MLNNKTNQAEWLSWVVDNLHWNNFSQGSTHQRQLSRSGTPGASGPEVNQVGNGPCSVWIPDFSKGNLSKNQVCFHKLEVWSDIQTRDHWTGRVDHLNESMIPYSESGSHLSVASKTSMKSTGSHRQVFNIVIWLAERSNWLSDWPIEHENP